MRAEPQRTAIHTQASAQRSNVAGVKATGPFLLEFRRVATGRPAAPSRPLEPRVEGAPLAPIGHSGRPIRADLVVSRRGFGRGLLGPGGRRIGDVEGGAGARVVRAGGGGCGAPLLLGPRGSLLIGEEAWVPPVVLGHGVGGGGDRGAVPGVGEGGGEREAPRGQDGARQSAGGRLSEGRQKSARLDVCHSRGRGHRLRDLGTIQGVLQVLYFKSRL